MLFRSLGLFEEKKAEVKRSPWAKEDPGCKKMALPADASRDKVYFIDDMLVLPTWETEEIHYSHGLTECEAMQEISRRSQADPRKTLFSNSTLIKTKDSRTSKESYSFVAAASPGVEVVDQQVPFKR